MKTHDELRPGLRMGFSEPECLVLLAMLALGISFAVSGWRASIDRGSLAASVVAVICGGIGFAILPFLALIVWMIQRLIKVFRK